MKTSQKLPKNPEVQAKVTKPTQTKEHSKKGYSTAMVVGVSILLAFLLSLVVFMLRFGTFKLPFSNFFNDHSKKSFQELYEEGLPKEGLKKLDKLSIKERNSANNMLWRGKLAFLATWKQYNDSSWDGYAENEEDWFTSEVLDDGIQALNQCLKTDDSRKEALLYLGLIYFEKGKYEKAEHYFKTLIRENPADSLGILNLAVLHSRQAKYREAVFLLEKGLTHHPKNSGYLKNLFWIYHFHLHKSEKAIDYGNRFLLAMSAGDPDKTKVIREIRDIISRFPEYDSDTLEIHNDEPPIFVPRKSAERMRMRNRQWEEGK